MALFIVNMHMKVVIFTSSAQGTHTNDSDSIKHNLIKKSISGQRIKNTTFYRYLGPYQIASWLRQNDVPTQVVDFVTYWSDEQLKKIVDKFVTNECKLVCFSPFVLPYTASDNLKKFISYKWNLLAKLCKDKNVNTLLGGPTAYEPLMDLKYIDKVWTTYGEDYVLSLVKETNKKFDITSDVMKFADNDILIPGESLPMEWSRGCVFKCKYCRYHNIGKKKTDHLKDPIKILETIEYNSTKFGTRNWTVTDDTLNAARNTIKELHQSLKHRDFKFAGYIRADLMHIWNEQITALPEMGFVSAFMGLESLNTDALKLVGKGWGGKNYKTKLKTTADNWGNSVSISAGMIAGIPPEKQKHWAESNQWLVDNTDFSPFWSALMLHEDKAQRLSVFELNAEKYGITFKSDQNKRYWRWGDMNLGKAQGFVSYITKHNAGINRNKPAGHYGFGFFNMGFDWETIRSSTKNKLNIRINNKNLLEKQLNGYYDRLMAY